MIRKNDKLLMMSQPDSINKIEKNFKNEFKSKLYQIPVAVRDAIVRTNKEDSIDATRQKRYRSGVGMLLYLIKYSRPDISNAVRELSKAMDMPNEAHWKALIRNLKFVVDTRMKALTYECDFKEDDKEVLILKTY